MHRAAGAAAPPHKSARHARSSCWTFAVATIKNSEVTSDTKSSSIPAGSGSPDQGSEGYLAVQECKYSSLLNDQVERIIVQAEDYIIYLNARWHVCTAGEIDYPPDYPRIYNEVLALEAAPCDYLKNEQRELLRMCGGHAIARVLDDRNPEAATEVLEQGWKYYAQRSAEVSRRWYLTTACACFIPLVVLAVIGATLDEKIAEHGHYALLMYFSVCMGGMGAFASTVLRLGGMCPDPSGGLLLHVLEGVARILVGCLGGFVLVICLLSEAVFSFVSANGEFAPYSPSFYLALLLSLASGISERTIPTLIKRINLEEERPLGELRSVERERSGAAQQSGKQPRGDAKDISSGSGARETTMNPEVEPPRTEGSRSPPPPDPGGTGEAARSAPLDLAVPP